MDARREFRISERDLRRAVGFGLVRHRGRMIVRADLEAFIAAYGQTRPTHPDRVKKGVSLKSVGQRAISRDRQGGYGEGMVFRPARESDRALASGRKI